MERIQKLIAQSGYCSRRDAEALIKRGVVSVNGIIATIGQSAKITDEIIVEGNPLQKPSFVYLILYKPNDYITTVKDPFAQKKVIDLLPDSFKQKGVKPVGRLDRDAEGLLFMTNDGDFANQLMHPRYTVKKTYRAWLSDRFSNQHKDILERGIRLKDGPVKNIYCKSVSHTIVDITVHVGKHKIVKRIFQHIGLRVKRLVRIGLGPYTLGSLKPGQYIFVQKKELTQVKK